MKAYIFMVILIVGFAATISSRGRIAQRNLERVKIESEAEKQRIEKKHSSELRDVRTLIGGVTAEKAILEAENTKLLSVIDNYIARESAAKLAAQKAIDEANQLKAETDDKARRVELDKRLGELAKIGRALQYTEQSIQKAEARLISARKNSATYTNVKTRHTCSKCGGTGKITTRKAQYIKKDFCKTCGGDGTYETSARQRAGTRSTTKQSTALSNLRKTKSKLQRAYTLKQAEADKLKR